MNLLEQIKHRMHTTGTSQAALARKAGISRPHLCTYLAGKRTASATTIERIMVALGAVDIEWDHRWARAE